MAFPKVLFLVAFLLLLSFWVDLCHQSNDVYSPREALLEKNKPDSNADSRRMRCSFRAVKVGSRQKIVVLVSLLVFLSPPYILPIFLFSSFSHHKTTNLRTTRSGRKSLCCRK
uniref:Uncharacterized protein n=1 Tax=Solanum tuberosum TaxID=4113 RepID=M1AZK5_SOLTU